MDFITKHTSINVPSLYQFIFAGGLLAGGRQGIFMNASGPSMVCSCGYALKSGSKSENTKIIGYDCPF